MKKGRKIWCPSSVIDELEDIKREDLVKENTEAFRKFVGYARVGREINRLRTLNWKRFQPLPTLEEYKKRK